MSDSAAQRGLSEPGPTPLRSMGEVPELEVASWQIPLLDVLGALTRHLWLVAILLTLGAARAGWALYTSEPFYTASSVAILLPREKPLIDATVDTGSLETTQDVARRSSTASLTLPPNTDLYVTLLKSASTLEVLAERFADQLKAFEGAEEKHRSPEMVAEIRSMVSITGTDDGLLTVVVEAHDAQLAADLANAVIEEGERASKEIERQLVLQQAGFLDEAAEVARKALERSEESFREFTRLQGVYDPDVEISQLIGQAHQLRKSADALRAELDALLELRTERDPTVVEKTAEWRSLDAQAQALEQSVRKGEDAARMGNLMLEREAMQQAVRFRRDLLITLTTQADIFRIRAEQPSGSIAVVRRASLPTRPAGPSKKATVGMSMGVSVVFSVFLILVLEQLALVRRTKELNERLDAALGNLLRWPLFGWPWRCLMFLARPFGAFFRVFRRQPGP